MLDKVIQHALEKYAGDESAATDFVEGFIKQAADKRGGEEGSFWDKSRKAETAGDTMITSLTREIGKGVGGLMIAGGATGAGYMFNMVREANLHNKFLQSLERSVQASPILRQAKREKVYNYGETVFKFAPNVACDPNLLTTILANAIQGESIDPMTIKTLTELEGRYKDNRQFTPKTYI
jgi:hypothetical protein